MSTIGRPISFIATTIPLECRKFYESTLNFKCLGDDDFALVFDLGEITLRVQKVETIPQENYTVLGWEVANIQQSVEELTHKGVQFEQFSSMPQDDLGIWRSPSGASIAWFKDPDGNTLSLTEQP